MKFGCSIGIFLNTTHLICRSTDISKLFRGSLRLRDNESRLYLLIYRKNKRTLSQKSQYNQIHLRIKDVETTSFYAMFSLGLKLKTAFRILCNRNASQVLPKYRRTAENGEHITRLGDVGCKQLTSGDVRF